VSLRRRLASEALGSVLLAATVIGSGVMAERLARELFVRASAPLRPETTRNGTSDTTPRESA